MSDSYYQLAIRIMIDDLYWRAKWHESNQGRHVRPSLVTILEVMCEQLEFQPAPEDLPVIVNAVKEMLDVKYHESRAWNAENTMRLIRGWKAP